LTPCWQKVFLAVDSLIGLELRRVLDGDVAAGRWGVWLRGLGEAEGESGPLRIEGIVPAFEPVSDRLRGLYDEIHVGEPADVLARLPGTWDVIVYGDALRRLEREAATELLFSSLTRSAYVLIVASLGEEPPFAPGEAGGGAVPGGAWQTTDLVKLPVVRSGLLPAAAGRPVGSFLLSRDDPCRVARSGVASLPDGTPGASPGPNEDLSRVVQRVAEMACELGYIKKSVTYRWAKRLRASSLWNGARWVRNRNVGVVTIRALGTHGPSARDAQVWLLGASPNAGEMVMPWDMVEWQGQWKEHAEPYHPYGRCYVTTRGRARVAGGGDPELRFITSAWSGRVEVAFRRRSETIDLWTRKTGELIVRPARSPMQAERRNGDERREHLAAREQGFAGGPQTFSSVERALIETVRQADRRTLVIYCPRWVGISSSTRALFEHAYPVPDRADVAPQEVDDASLRRYAAVIAETGIDQLVVSGGDEVHLRLVRLVRRKLPRLRVDLLWHGSYVQFSEYHEWELMQKWIDAARAGEVQSIGTVKKGMERFFLGLGIKSRLVLNFVPGTPMSPPAIDGQERRVGTWVSKTTYRKIPHAMLSALAMLPNCRLHAAGLDDSARKLVQYLGIRVGVMHPGPLPHDDLMQAMRETHASLYVTFSECCPMLPLESMMVGVPCLIGPTSHLFEDHPYLFERLVVPFPDRADIIADFLERALGERDRIITEYREYLPGYNEAARRSVAEFLA